VSCDAYLYNTRMPRGLYIHIPFCLKKCHYCDYVITLDRSSGMREQFLTALGNEIRHSASRYGRLRFDTLYLGGGTPSAFTADEMRQVLDAVRRNFDFETGYELTCEVNPGDVDTAKLQCYRQLGVNRISLGVQSLNEKLLQDMGRPHGVREIEEMLAMVRQESFDNVSIDLILRLPEQTMEDWQDSLTRAARFVPGQFSLYDLDVTEGTVYGVRERRGQLIRASEAIHAQMMDFAETFLNAEGYTQYDLNSFARPGFESRHNLIYWHNQEYLGLGPSAFSYLDGTRSQFAPTVSRYLDKCGKADWQPDLSETVSPEKKEIESLLTGLRLRKGFSLTRLAMMRQSVEDKIKPLIADGFLTQEDDKIFFTRKGRFVAESIFAQLV